MSTMTPSVIGIDLGSSTSYVAKVENGGVVLLTNEINSRSTPSILSLPSTTTGTRMIGASAESHLITHPDSSVRELTSLLGADVLDLGNHHESGKLTTSNGKVCVSLSHAGQNRLFVPEQLAGTMLKYLKRIVSEDNENQNNAFILSVPNYFTDVERSALLDAARIAQVNVVNLMNDITASALAYGYFQKNLPNAVPPPINLQPSSSGSTMVTSPPIGERPRMVIFIDFGHTGIQAGLVAFSADGLRIVATQTDRTVGGKNFDHKLALHLMEAFNTKYKSRGVCITPKSHPKVFSKLLTVAEKLKRQMSANRNVLPVDVECLWNDYDLNTEICRETFERLCQDLFDKIRNCLVQLLQRSQIDRDSLHSVEILGGSSRVPLFKSIVEEVFLMQPSTTLNADEAVARGCALMCALSTKVFKVKPFYVYDIPHHTTQIRYACKVPESSSNSMMSFSGRGQPQGPAVHSQSKVVFSRNGANHSYESVIELEEIPQGNTLALEYCLENEEPGQDDDLRVLKKNLIAIYNFKLDAPPTEGSKLQLHFILHCGGIVRLRSMKLVQTAKRVKYDDKNLRERAIEFTETRVGGLPDKELQALAEDEVKLEAEDAKEKLREETKNRLEEFTFALRDELENLSEVVQQEEAWSIIVKYIRALTNHFETDDYENSPTEFFKSQMEDMQKKKTVFMVWLQKFNQKLERDNMRFNHN